MRRLLMIHFIVVGFVIQAASYFLMAAAWGFPPEDVSYSNPRIPFAPVIFIAGIMLVFLGVLIYELLPERKSEHEQG